MWGVVRILGELRVTLGWSGRAGPHQAVMSDLYMCSPPQWKGGAPQAVLQALQMFVFILAVAQPLLVFVSVLV